MKKARTLTLIALFISLHLFGLDRNEIEEKLSSRGVYELSPTSYQTKDESGENVYEFDRLNQLRKVVFPNGQSVEYQYDFRNNLSRLVYPNLSEVRFSYDLDNRLKKIHQKSGETLFEYDNIKNLLKKKIFPNGIIVEYGYNVEGRMNKVAYFKKPGHLFAIFEYEFDNNGNRKRIRKEYNGVNQEVNYKYDKLNRLLEANYSDGGYEHFTYDGLGNRLTKTTPERRTIYIYNEKNQLIHYDEVTLSYDSLGNLEKKETPTGTITYSYDKHNRLSKVQNGAVVVCYEYDFFGNRIAKIVNGTRTNYINDLRTSITNVLVEETNGHTTQYCYAAGVHSSEGPNGDYFYLFDSPNRNVAFLANETGGIKDQYEYTSFGELKKCDNEDENNHLYAGQQYDKETGLIFLRNRYYDPEVGRFISVDSDPGTFFNPQTLNPYTYVLNNPINLIDLTGRHGELPPEGQVFYDVCAYDRVPWCLHLTLSGHGWQEFTYSDGLKKSIGHHNLKKSGGSTYYRIDDHLHIDFPESRIQTLRFTVSEEMAESIFQATKTFCSHPYMLLKHNCIDAVKAGMDAAGISHPHFKTAGVSDPLQLHHYIWHQNAKRNARSAVSSVSNWFNGFISGTQGGIAVDNASSFNYSPLSQPDFGGVSLSKRAEMTCELPGIKGVVYDHALGRMVFFGEENSSLPKMNFDDLAVAIRSLYGLGNKPPQHPGVSIDPSKNPKYHSVRYDGTTENTHFGWVMFEADRILKCLVSGIDNHTGKKMKVKVPGYKSLVSRYEDSKKHPEEHTARFWFIPKRIELSRSDDRRTIIFSDVKMDVCHESRFNKGIKTDPHLEAFAKHFTNHYEAYAKQYPIFQELLELGKITAMIKWIQDFEIPIDLDYFRNYTPLGHQTPTRTNTLATAFMDAGNLFLFSGGVVYACSEHNTFYEKSSKCDQIEDIVLKQQINEEDSSWIFDSSELEEETCVAKAFSWVKTRKPGNFKRTHVDFSFPVLGDHELTFVRYYDSFHDSFSPLGYGWKMLSYSLKPIGQQINMSFVDGVTRLAYPFLILQDHDQERLFKLLGMDGNRNLVYSSERSSDALSIGEDSPAILYKSKGKSIYFLSNGLPDKEVDVHGIELYYHYRDHLLCSIEHQSGCSINFEYVNGKLSKAWSLDGTLLHYHYDQRGQLEKVSNALGEGESYQYDKNLRLNQIYDANRTPVFEGRYDDYNRLTHHKKRSFEFNHTYDPSGKIARLSTDLQTVSEVVFDDQNHLLSSIDILNNRRDLIHSSSLIDNRDGWEYEYNEQGNLTSICDPTGKKTLFIYDEVGNLKLQEEPNGNVIQYVYDHKNQLIQVYYKGTHQHQSSYSINDLYFESFNDIYDSVKYDYNEWGNLSFIQHSTGPSAAINHNDNGLITKVTTSLGYSIERDYDDCSRLKWIKDPSGRFTEYFYNEIGRLKVISNHGKEEKYTYYPNGALHVFEDPKGNQTQYFYDNLGRLERVIDAESIETFIDYSSKETTFYQS